MKRLIILLWMLLHFISCTHRNDKKITNVKDYEKFLQISSQTKTKKIDEEIDFWKKKLLLVNDDIAARSRLAALFTKRFARSGNIVELHQADSIYQLILPLNRKTSSGTYRSLANICISMHRFKAAQDYLDSAMNLGDDKYLTLLMDFDVAMELGNYTKARKELQSLEKENSFEFLIRKSKYKDHVEGKQDEAITLMEQAYEKIKGQGNQDLELWVKSNLGDLYSHANRLDEAYKTYLAVLNLDPDYYHALKGIGWIAYSHDKDMQNAKNIFESLLKLHAVPDYLLQLGQISGSQNRFKEQEYYYSRFLNETMNPLYGDMYNKYVFYLQSDELKDYNLAYKIAEREVNNRPTPESYNLLAWAYFRKGDTQRALSIATGNVENRCFEPDALYHLGIINMATDKQKARKYLLWARKSSYELGPALSKEIEHAISRLRSS